MLIEIVTPTLNREEKLKRLVGSVVRTTHPKVQMMILPDKDGSGWIRTVNRYLLNVTADIVLVAGDDIELREGCLEAIDVCFARYFPDLDGVVGINQCNLPGASKGGLLAIGGKFLERYPGNMCFCPEYKHLGADREVYEYAESIGKFHFCEEARANHFHPAFFPQEADETHRVSNRLKAGDPAIKAKRKAAGYLWGKDFNLLNGLA